MVIILMGVSGAGKTTVGKALAEALHWPFFDADDFHPQSNIEKMTRHIPLTDDDRGPWLEILQNKITGLIAGNVQAVLACSALKQAYRDQLGYHQQQVRFVYLRGTFELIKTRLIQRQSHYMSMALLASQFAALEEPQNIFTVDIDAPVDAIVATIKSKAISAEV